jgi:hypothetical protein
LIIEGQEEAPTTSSDISGFETDQPDKSELPATTGSGDAVLPMEVMEHETMVRLCAIFVFRICVFVNNYQSRHTNDKVGEWVD